MSPMTAKGVISLTAKITTGEESSWTVKKGN